VGWRNHEAGTHAAGLGAQIFLWARVAYALIYIAGLPWVRTAVWGASVVGLAMIFVQLV